MKIRKPTKDEFDYWLKESTLQQAKDRAYTNNSSVSDELPRLKQMIPILFPNGMSSEGVILRVFDVGGNLNCGFIWFGLVPGLPEQSIFLFDIVLKSMYRSKGYGRMFLTKMHKVVNEKGYNFIMLSVLKKNYAMKLYENLGYRIINEEEKHAEMMIKL